MIDKKSINWASIGTEFIAITFGVLLGIWLSGLQGDRERSSIVERMRTSLQAELATNFDEISKSRSYHLELIPDVVAARRNLEQNKDYKSVAYRGFGTVPNRTAGYNTALATGIFADVGPEDSEAIISAYIAINELIKIQERYLSALTTVGSDTKSFFDLISFAFSDMLYAEDRALTAIGEAIGQEPPASWRSQTTTDPYSESDQQ